MYVVMCACEMQGTQVTIQFCFFLPLHKKKNLKKINTRLFNVNHLYLKKKTKKLLDIFFSVEVMFEQIINALFQQKKCLLSDLHLIVIYSLFLNLGYKTGKMKYFSWPHVGDSATLFHDSISLSFSTTFMIKI